MRITILVLALPLVLALALGCVAVINHCGVLVFKMEEAPSIYPRLGQEVTAGEAETSESLEPQFDSEATCLPGSG